MKELREAVRHLLTSGHIEVMLGWKCNSHTGGVRPAVFKKKDDVSDVVFNENCIQNLTTFLPRLLCRYNRIGVVLKTCDGRSLVSLIQENKIDRERIVILSPACSGVMCNGEKAGKCSDCPSSVSPIADNVFGEKAEHSAPLFSDVQGIMEMNAEDRWAFFSVQFRDCMRCYACREVCPLCYCETCAADNPELKWIETSPKLSSNTMWHLTRAFHHAGRCADCGECERVCPSNIKLRLLNNVLEQTVIKYFGVRPGMTIDQNPPLNQFSEQDTDELLEGSR